MFGNSEFEVKSKNGYNFIEQKGKKNSTPLVLLHGMFGGLSNFDPLLKRFSQHPILIPEIPVYDMKRSNLTIPKLSGWVRGFIEAMKVENPILLGNSMGGHIALQYALDYPDEVSALILTGSSGLFENHFGSTRPRRQDREYIRQQAALTFYEDLVNDTIIDEIMEVLNSRRKLIKLLKIARVTHDHNLEDELGNIVMPTLLVWGKNDVITPPRVAETFRDKIPNAVLRWIDRCGHAPMMERPDQFVDILHEFLADFEKKRVNKDGFSDYEENYSH